MNQRIEAPPGHEPAAPEDPTLVEPAPAAAAPPSEQADPTMHLPMAPLAPAEATVLAGNGRAYAIVAGVIALMLLVSLAASPSQTGDGGDEPVVTTLTTAAPTTTVAPVEDGDEGRGRGNGKGHKGDDDDD